MHGFELFLVSLVCSAFWTLVLGLITDAMRRRY